MKKTLYRNLILFAFILISLFITSDALKDSSQFSRFYSGLLIFTLAGLGSLVIMIFLNIKQLAQQYYQQVPGTRMIIKMIGMFTALSFTPVLIVYFFSLDLLHRGIDSWFDLNVEQALDDSLQISRLSLDARMRELLKQTEQIAEEISALPNDVDIPLKIDTLRKLATSREITLFDKKGTIITSSSEDAESIIPNNPNETILLQLQQGGSYTALDNIKSEIHIRVVVNIPNSLNNDPRIVQALYPVSEKINNLANRIQLAYTQYTKLSYLREQLKISFILILTLVLLFSILATFWTAVHFAKKHVAPIKDMAEGTKSIASGDYHTQIPTANNDELGFLIKSFNEMTQKIAQARQSAKDSQNETEKQQAYLEAILGRLSSGVLVFDQNKILRTSNPNAGHILGVDIHAMIDNSLEDICTEYHYLLPLQEAILSHTDTEKDWREQIILFGKSGRQILMCSGTPQSLIQYNKEGYIIVFDDITEMIQGQKNTVWSEMARRLAHEIKNPLTPIQFAAERLRQKYLSTMKPDDADVLDRLTNTIVQQVETMKIMVNKFSDYAKSSEIKQQPLNLNELIHEVLDLFINLDQETKIVLDLDADLPMIKADANRMRQVFNNLIKNAFDACENSQQPMLNIVSRQISTAGIEYVEILIRDSGHGVKEDMMEYIFEPYVTDKTKGTGLGLAIAKKIIEEHNGTVCLKNNQHDLGASAIIQLPTIQNQANDDQISNDEYKIHSESA